MAGFAPLLPPVVDTGVMRLSQLVKSVRSPPTVG
jgi:hypothetical protein